MQEAPTQSFARMDSWCPVCGAAAERGQLVCLECGSRVTLAYRRPASLKVPIAIGFAVLIVAVTVALLAYRAIDDDAAREVAATPAQVAGRGEDDGQAADERSRGEAAAGDDQAKGDDGGRATDSPRDEPRPGDDERRSAANEPRTQDDDGSSAQAAGGLVKNGQTYSWPSDLRAFTVVLLSAEDRVSANGFARSAAASAGAKIGVIRSNDFESLPQGFFVVFAGSYPDRPAADRAAARLSGRFEGAFPQLVRP